MYQNYAIKLNITHVKWSSDVEVLCVDDDTMFHSFLDGR